MKWRLQQSGFSLIAAIVLMVLTITAGAAIVTIITNVDESLRENADAQSAESLAQLGLQRELTILEADTNWSDNTTPNTGSFGGGTYVVTKSGPSTDSITVNSLGQFKGNEYTINRVVTRANKQSRDISLDSSGISVITASREIANINIINAGTTAVTVEKVVVVWEPSGTIEIEEVKINGGAQWKFDGTAGSPTGRQPSNTLLVLDGFNLLGSTTVPLNLVFDGSVLNREYTVFIYMTDGSSASTQFSLVPGPQAGSLNIDVSGTLFALSNRAFYNLKLGNTSTVFPISFKHLKMTWADRPSTNVFQSRMYNPVEIIWDSGGTAGTPVGLQPSGTTLNVVESRTNIDPSTTRNLVGEFDMMIKYRRVTIDITMSDDTTKSAVLDTTFPQANFLERNSSAANVISNALTGLTLRNTHSEGWIWLDKLKVGVTPSSGQTVSSVVLNDVPIYSGPGALGTTLDVTVSTINTTAMPVTINFSSLSKPVTTDLTFIMEDATTTTSAIFVDKLQMMISTHNARMSYDRLSLFGISVTNNSGTNTTITNVLPSWIPNGGERVVEVGIGAPPTTSVSALSGSSITMVPATPMNNGQNESMAVKYDTIYTSRDTDFVLTYGEGSTQNFTVNHNPANSTLYFAGDNFESGNLSGGAGFTDSWHGSGTTINNNWRRVYSGRSAMRVRNGTNRRGCRTVTYHNPPKVRFWVYIRRNWDASDEAFVKATNGTCNASCTNTGFNLEQSNIVTLNNTLMIEEGNTFFEFDLSSKVSSTFCFLFHNTAAGGGEHLFVDEIYFPKY